MSFGVLPEGFKKPTFEEIREILVAEAENLYGPINLGPESAIGQEITIRAEREALLWEALEAVYQSQYPNSASGLSLDQVASLVGVSRLPATRTIVNVDLIGDSNTVIPQGSQASTTSGDVFELVSEVTLDGSGDGQGQMRALETGPILALAGTLTEIETSVSGWDSLTNPDDGSTGQAIESDSSLRLRRAESLSLAGVGTVEAIRARLIREVDDVNSVSIFENATPSVDSDGRSPHSFEVVIEGGIDQAIGDQLWILKPAGIETFGDISVTVVDSQGENQLFNFSRPVQIFVWIKIELTGSFPSGIEDDVKNALVTYGQENFGVGENVIKQQLFAPLYSTLPALESAEILLASSTDAGVEPDPSEFLAQNLEIGSRETSQWLDNRIEVTIDE